ncbi:MAG TPA: 3'-5' exonuclease, partial [Phycisphaerae bacterium]|nr:3'-5' exonuclease [Phycisphaerae bacterium]
LADRLRRRFRHILFDEYQDINPLQQQLIKLLSRVENPVADLPAGSIFCVGDVFQSIYGFRGSRPQLLQEQVDQIKTTGRGDVVSMMENFRTLPPLIDAFNLIFPHVFADSENPEEPLLRHGRAKSPENISNVLTGAPLELHVICKSDADGANQNTDNETSNESDQDSGAGVSDAPDIDDPIADLEKAEREALLVARMIREMRGSGRKIMEKNADAPPRPIEFDDIAILMRTKQIQATQFVRILGEHGIPAYAEMTTGFFAAQEILEVLDLLHVLDNPAQDIPLASVLLGPLGNFSHAQLVRIRTKFPDRRKIAFHGAVPLFALEKHSAPQDQDLAERLGAFLNQLNQWRQMVNTLGVGEGLNHIYQTSGLLSSTAALPGGEQKLANLHLLRQKALEYSAASHEGLSGFAAFVRDLEQVDLGAAPIPAPGAVKVMSIHAAKGLEFPVVFLIGLGKKFNMRDLNGYLIVDDSGLGLQVFHQINGGMVRTASPEYQIVKQAKKLRLAEEEARLLYVAMTRARDRLVLVGHAPGTQNKAGENWSRLAPGKDVDRMLDWLGPIFTNIPPSEQNQLLQLVWHDSSSIAPQPVASSAKVGKSSGRPAADPNWTAMRAGQTLPEPPPQNPGLQTVIRRITTPYPYQKFTELAAVTTVSKLKTAAEDFDEFPSPSFDPPEEFSLQIQPASTGIQRGTATHTILQQLDLRADLSLDGIRVQIEKLISSGQIPPDVAATVDAAGIAWFFTTTPGQQMQEIAMKKARGDNSAEILREQVFLWRNSDATNSDRFDDVLVRGAIDVLLIDGKNVQIIDYKTDAPTMIESRLPAYRKQVQYYARAAGDILKTPITTATLVFLSAHRCEIVDL